MAQSTEMRTYLRGTTVAQYGALEVVDRRGFGKMTGDADLYSVYRGLDLVGHYDTLEQATQAAQ